MKINSKEFDKLREKWNKKLKKSGFVDIEQKDGNLTKWHTNYFIQRYSPTTFSAKETYYRLAGQFLEETEFKTKFDHNVWKFHSEGLSIRDIVIKINRTRRRKVQRTTVFRTIKRLAEEMKQKYETRDGG